MISLHPFHHATVSTIVACLIVILSIHPSSPSCQALGISVAAAGIGPVIASNFPDPSLALDTSNGTGVWYAFSTQTGAVNVQLASSSDFSHWTLHNGYDALPKLPSWAISAPHIPGVWAPDVNQRPDGSWVMYFAAVGPSHPHKHCIGAATSDRVEGPYIPLETPLVCESELKRGGVIDPNLFVDPTNQQSYLIYKVDGNAIGHGGACANTKEPVQPTPLYLQVIDRHDLITPIGEPYFLITNIGSFKEDGPNVERPCMIFRNSTYYLLYNAKCFAGVHYRIDYVSCTIGVDTQTGLLGCDWAALKSEQQTRADRTLLKSNDTVSGTTFCAPGSMDVSPDQTKVVFHGDINLQWFEPHKPHTIKRDRAMYAAQIDLVNSNLHVSQLF